jgi:aryl-alcohol dehydrogenase-like predicted oxidoreductase
MAVELRQLGKSEVKVTPVIFGAWAIGGWMWGGNDDRDAQDAVRASIDNGVNAIDTAAIYGMGHSETLVGQAIKGRRDKVVIATKCGMIWWGDEGFEPWEQLDNSGKPVTIRKNSRPASIDYECEQSLKRLGIDVIDLYQIHRPDMTTPVDQAMNALEKLRKQGKVRAIGVSNFNLEWHKNAYAAVPFATSQPTYSLLQRGIEQDLVPFCIEHKVGIICYSPLERGLLTGAVGPDRKFNPGDHREKHHLFKVENRQRIADALAKIQPIADAHKASLAQIVIQWTVHQPGITAALVGARNAQQAEHNAKALGVSLTPAEIQQMTRVFEDCAKTITK